MKNLFVKIFVAVLAAGVLAACEDVKKEEQSLDLMTLGLRGPVKMVVEYYEDFPEGKETFIFNEDGNLVKYEVKDAMPNDTAVIRENGRIKQIGKVNEEAFGFDDYGSSIEYFYDEKGRVCKTVFNEWEGYGETLYLAFNENGWPTESNEQYDNCGTTTKSDIKFQYETDEQGNWTRRTATGTSVETYEGMEDDEQPAPEEFSRTLVRKIEYYGAK